MNKMDDCLKIIALILVVFIVYLYMKKERKERAIKEGQASRRVRSTCGR